MRIQCANRMKTRMWSPDCGVAPAAPPDIDGAAEETGPAVRADENMPRPGIPPAAALPVLEERGALDEKNMFAQLQRLYTRTRRNPGSCESECSRGNKKKKREERKISQSHTQKKKKGFINQRYIKPIKKTRTRKGRLLSAPV